MLIDTHAHIYLNHFKDDLDETISSAKESGVGMILMPNIDSSTLDSMLEVESRYDAMCKSMIGLHPCSVKQNYKEELDLVDKELATGKYIAVGEMGTDLYWDKTFWTEQQDAFNEQMVYAEKYGLPIVIHCRESLDQTIDLVSEFPGKITGVFHCFTGSVDQYKRITDLGFSVGIGGVSTFKNSGMNEVLDYMELEHVVLETDSPYLAPVPRRGKRNEPSFLQYVALKLAEVKRIGIADVEEQTTTNAKKLFNL